MTTERNFTPALGKAWLTPLYDLAIGALTREGKWRRLLAAQIDPHPGERILDVGCGTGSLAVLLKTMEPAARVTGIDPDGTVLAIARRKAAARRAEVSFVEGFLAGEFLGRAGPFDKIVSSLVFHQVPLDEKARIFRLMREGLVPGGTLHVADYGLQRTAVSRFLFRATVQRLDGLADTQPNADGILPELMAKAGFANVEERFCVPTVTGSLSLYRAQAA